MTRTALKKFCSSHSWKHQRDQHDEQKSSTTSAPKTDVWTTLSELAGIIHLQKAVPSEKSVFHIAHTLTCQEIGLRKSKICRKLPFSDARNSGLQRVSTQTIDNAWPWCIDITRQTCKIGSGHLFLGFWGTRWQVNSLVAAGRARCALVARPLPLVARSSPQKHHSTARIFDTGVIIEDLWH